MQGQTRNRQPVPVLEAIAHRDAEAGARPGQQGRQLYDSALTPGRVQPDDAKPRFPTHMASGSVERARYGSERARALLRAPPTQPVVLTHCPIAASLATSWHSFDALAQIGGPSQVSYLSGSASLAPLPARLSREDVYVRAGSDEG
eukprot:scaffold1411_cov396-Prasinococcus_capsulatus_cf.AAC.10